MIAPTRAYDGLPGLSADEAAGWIITAARAPPGEHRTADRRHRPRDQQHRPRRGRRDHEAATDAAQRDCMIDTTSPTSSACTAGERPDAPALVVGDRTITFGELDARSSRAAQAFARAGIGFGDRVAFVETQRRGVLRRRLRSGQAGRRRRAGQLAARARRRCRHIIDDCGGRRWSSSARSSSATSRPSRTGSTRRHRRDRHARPLAGLRRLGGRPPRRRPRRAHRARRSGVPDVHVGHHRAAQGRHAEQRQLPLQDRRGRGRPWRFTADAVSLAVMPLFHMAGSGWAFAGLWRGRHHRGAARRRPRRDPRRRSPSTASPTCCWCPP